MSSASLFGPARLPLLHYSYVYRLSFYIIDLTGPTFVSLLQLLLFANDIWTKSLTSYHSVHSMAPFHSLSPSFTALALLLLI
jgi:hypothetical protein